MNRTEEEIYLYGKIMENVERLDDWKKKLMVKPGDYLTKPNGIMGFIGRKYETNKKAIEDMIIQDN